MSGYQVSNRELAHLSALAGFVAAGGDLIDNRAGRRARRSPDGEAAKPKGVAAKKKARRRMAAASRRRNRGK